MAQDDKTLALRALRLLDLTDLSDDCGEAAIVRLCARAVAPPAPVAAICIWPRHVTVARRVLGESPVRVATVVNFPAGGTNVGRVSADVVEAIGDGAQEIDLVLPYEAMLSGDDQIAADMVSEVKAACAEGGALLKVILETGSCPTPPRSAGPPTSPSRTARTSSRPRPARRPSPRRRRRRGSCWRRSRRAVGPSA